MEKKMKKQFTLFGVVMITAIILSACASPTPQTIVQTQIVAGTPQQIVVTATPGAAAATPLPKGSVQINGAGATFPLPVYTAWTYAYSYVDPSVIINYQGIGSGGGKKAAIDNTVDFAGSDSLVTDDEYKAGKDLQMLPALAGAVVPIYNIKFDNDKDIKPEDRTITLDRETLTNIYLGKITKWNDPALVKLNPKLEKNLPNAAIYTVRRSDGSGTTEIFTRALSSFSAEWKEKVGAGSSVEWPAEKAKLPAGGGRGNQGVAAQVQLTDNSIGYVELSFAIQNGITYTKLVNKAGKTVTANGASVNSAMADYAEGFDAKLTAVIVDGKGEKSWPITGYTYYVIHMQNMNDCVKAKKLLDYMTWTLTDASAAQRASDLGYSVLPDAVKAQVVKKLGEVTCNGKPVLSKL
jgi:phosphate transport system substrate-binding protein